MKPKNRKKGTLIVKGAIRNLDLLQAKFDGTTMPSYIGILGKANSVESLEAK